MRFKGHHSCVAISIFMVAGICFAADGSRRDFAAEPIGSEHAIGPHLQDGQEFTESQSALLQFGRKLFIANWTVQDGQGRPMTKGTGAALSDPTSPLVFPRNFNRISAPDSNSCAGCHN